MWAWDPQRTPVSCAELIALSRVRVTVCADSIAQSCEKTGKTLPVDSPGIPNFLPVARVQTMTTALSDREFRIMMSFGTLFE